ncbi:MAG: cellulase family glycosylhydrolase [Sedimentisphaerales bacterium]|nr:cellulase family glycosylhydrolase [Sedimentisphaerales bacterium]
MVDQAGRKVLLRGVGLGNWLLPEGYMWRFGDQGDRPRKIEKIISDLIGQEAADRFWSEFRRNYITEADIKKIAELGFNSVRPAINARMLLTEGANPKYLDEGFELLDNLVRWCTKYKVYVILDMHGAPGGQTGANIDDSRSDEPELFTDTANQDRLVDLWVRLADRYKDEPYVAGYDLLNEPLPVRTGAAAKYKHLLEPLYKRITRAIREKDKRHMIILEGVDWANDWSVFTSRFDDNLVYSFHYYCWDRPTTLKDISQYLVHRARLDAPVWVGETGEKDNAIYWATTQLFEAHNIGWSFWPWKKMETQNAPYSIKAPEGWEAIQAYSRGRGKPSRQVAQKAFDQILVNIRLENCVYNPDVVNAIFRRVPGKVEAENYGHEGLNKSYFVKDASGKAQLYRTSEPVQITAIEAQDSSQQGQGQAIHLVQGEWTAYMAHSLESRQYKVAVKVKAETGPAVLCLTVNDYMQELTVTDPNWANLKADTIWFHEGANRILLEVKAGAVCVDWMDFQ